MSNSVIGVVRRIGRDYADGTSRVEIHIPIEKANDLPLQLEERVPVTLQIGGVEYMAGLRSTKKNRYAWICPDIYLHDGNRLTLGRVLSNAELRPNNPVQLMVEGLVIALRPGQQENNIFPGLEQYKLDDTDAATFYPRFTLVLPNVDLETPPPPTPDSMLEALRDVAGIYFWTMRMGSSTYKIYVGKTKSLPRRLRDYTNEFQVHAPNDYKLLFFQSFVRTSEPAAAFDLYFVKQGPQGYTIDETEAIKQYRPFINERAKSHVKDRAAIKQAFEAFYLRIFAQTLGTAE